MAGPMAYLAPGHSRVTACAITCAVECRSTVRPRSEPAVITLTRELSGNGADKSRSRAIDEAGYRRLGQTRANGRGQVGHRRPRRKLPRGTVGQAHRYRVRVLGRVAGHGVGSGHLANDRDRPDRRKNGFRWLLQADPLRPRYRPRWCLPRARGRHRPPPELAGYRGHRRERP